MKRCVVLLSGGLDSAVALAWAADRGREVHALTFDYHLRPAQEVEATRALAAAYGVPLRSIAVPFLREASDIPPGERLNDALAEAPEGYVPARNLVFYAIAANVAETIGACTIVGGHHGEDATLFPDASPSFFEHFAALTSRGVWSFRKRPFHVELPLSGLAKPEVVRLGLDLGAPLGLTWSCYADGPRSCGLCRSCRERADAFRDLGVRDPGASATGR